MKNKIKKEDSKLNNLDNIAEKIGMGGNLIPNITEEKYRERMNRRKEVQIKRLKERFLRELKVQEIEDLKSNPELKDKIVENSLDSNENLRKVFTGKNN